MIHTIKVILKEKKLEAAILICVFSIVGVLLFLPVSLSDWSEIKFEIDLELIKIDSQVATCQVLNSLGHVSRLATSS